MAIQFSIRSTTTGTIAVMRRLGAFVSAKSLRAIGDRLVFRITNRTRSGKAATGRRFTPYTATYAARKGVSPRNVTLRDTGAMQNAVQVVRATSRSFEIGVRGREGVKARVHHYGLGSQPARPWLAFSRQDRSFLRKELKQAVRDQITMAKRRGRRA